MALAEKGRVAMKTSTTLLLSTLFFFGCTGDIVELSAHDAGTNTHQDSGTVNNPDGGGGGGGGDMAQPANLTFSANIYPDIMKYGCSAAGSCHGNGTQVPVLSATDVNADYAAFKTEVLKNGAGATSYLLTHLLAGATPIHGGGPIFPSTQDATYLKWLAWINQGYPP